MSYIPVYSTRINWENEPSIVSPINATNLNKMDYALKAHDDTLANWDITKANESDLLLALKEVSYDTDTGVFVFTWFNGTTSTIDLNIEKIPVSFSMDANGVITMTTEDGTTYTADVGALIKTYTFTDSSVIDFTVTTDASGNKTVTADIVDGSIDGTKLTPNYLADCTQAKTGAETAATNSAASSQDAEAWAVGTRGGVPVPSTDPAYENNAEYWAHHTSSSLAGLTDTDISSPSDGEVLKYNSTTSKWENGQAAAGGGSTIAVSTSESALYGQNVTLTDGVTTLTGAFDNTGHATFSGVTMTGNLTIACLTASTSLNVPYFGNYTAVVSSFSASITVTYPGGTCTCVGNGESYTASSSPYTFTVHGAATYTITVTIDGVSKTDTVVITTDGQTETSTIEFGTINVTYENDFKGVSITCTLGATTITKTAPTTGNTMVFYPPTTGSWTISGTVGGVPYPTTANVTSLSTPVSVNLETIPDGSTATPTDDIQKWLACAGIKDKAYTTLTQVLGDSETYNALLGDSNACAYMKRSTTWSTDICADQYAMNLLGQYDTACDALLSDSTWTTALNNSSYWYGHTDSGVLIHGGNPTYDSFYRIVDGNHVPVTDPSLLDAGTYTIYSNGLAKDPDNLSNDYGKTVRICPNTKEIVVRPDNSLYWYGHESTTLLMAPNDAFNKSTYSLDLNTTASNGSNVTSSPIDVSDASTLHEVITIGATHNSGYPIQLECLVNAPTASFNLTNYKDVDIATYKGQISHQTMDISSYSGDRYLGIYMYAAATSAGGKVHAIWYE